VRIRGEEDLRMDGARRRADEQERGGEGESSPADGQRDTAPGSRMSAMSLTS
jgi:hypothetical protein